MLNYTRIPAPRVSIVDPQTGIVSNEWFRFFNNLYTIAYSGTNVTTAGTYGSASVVAQITINDFGGIIGLSNITIAIDASQIVSGTLPIVRGGTGLGTLPSDGQLLIGDVSNGYVLNTLTPASGIGITNAPGAITVANTGVLSNIAGTGVSVSGATGNVTIANTGVLSTIAGTGVSVSGATGNVTIANTGVLSFSAGTTGLTPSTTTTGAVTLAGTLGLANGGTGGTTAATARTNLGVTATGADTTYAFRANNLSDLASAATARTNLGLGTMAVKNIGVSGTFTTADSKTVTVTDGIITSIV